MAERPKFDWTLAKSLYFTDLPLKEIAEKVGCKLSSLKARVLFGGWAVQKAKLNQRDQLDAVKSQAVQLSIGTNARIGDVDRLDCALEGRRMLGELKRVALAPSHVILGNHSTIWRTVVAGLDVLHGWSEQDRVAGAICVGEVEDLIEQKGIAPHLGDKPGEKVIDLPPSTAIDGSTSL